MAEETAALLRALPEILSRGNIARGHLLEICKSAEDADSPRLKRAIETAAPHLIMIHAGLLTAVGVLTRANRGTFEQRDHTDAAVVTALGVDLAMRGRQGTVLYHTRIAQSEALQAAKLLVFLERRHDERDASAAAWDQFERAVFIVADEFDSIVFSFRVLINILGLATG